MLERVYIKNHLSFNEIELNFAPGLSVFTGVSGAGKSVLMNAILAVFGLKEAEAKIIEADISHEFGLDEFGIENETPNNFRILRDKSVRYFINSQLISKKNLTKIAGEYVKFLGAKNADEINSASLLELLDFMICKNDSTHGANLANFRAKFSEFLRVQKELRKIEEEENKIEELKEFAKFEIEKIEQISPKIGEYEELLVVKKKLSKKDKIEELWARAEGIFEFERSVIEVLNLSEMDSAFFEDAMNELRVKMESLNLDELGEIDIEAVLNRLEALSGLNKRYGDIAGALDTLERRRAELAHYEQISFEKRDLNAKFDALNLEISNLATLISAKRKASKNALESLINRYLDDLYMPSVRLDFSEQSLEANGSDEVRVMLNNTEFKNLSSGETNRLRLAFIGANLEITNQGSGILILDEIDSNLSGKEAMSIATVLEKISKYYQIFAISHQPQLSSKAHSHFLITKNGEISSVKLLNESEKITELARMISGETISKEALEFAKKLKN
ncbi:AAA family ATPase [Campylobacter sp. JMF_04 NA10]|uniref:AAA family ATPase n=1 Tax=Campylobacter sp. JMF_04 NA10 TaxID=2983824 RepID=UPI0022E9A810|nr:AAA family ATPase [Campylobacter sp. JMF_04 NA10]MDA3076389.1 AAA family ATPase [Campylobacter sp. JMF_04 NA10]